MARNATLKEIKDRVYELGELRPVYVSEIALREEINQSLADLCAQIVQTDQGYYEKTDVVTVVSGTDSYALPADYFKTLGVDVLQGDGSTYVNLRKYNYADRNMFSTGDGVERTNYRIRGNFLSLIPTPSWDGTVRHLYAPTAPKLVGDGDTFDGIAGMEDFVVYDCLCKFIGGKEESDASVWMDLRERARQRVLSALKHRDRAEPDRIRDVDQEEARVWPRRGY